MTETEAGQQSGTSALSPNKQVMHEYLEEFWNNGDFSIAEKTIAPNAYFHDFEDSPDPIPQGLAGVKMIYSNFQKAFPDIRMDIDDMIEEGDKVAVRWTVKGTQTGVFQGIPPTYREIDFTGTTIVRIADGKIAEGWQNMDIIKGMQQLGVIGSGGLPAPMKWMIGVKGKLYKRKLDKA
jgi:steroid delta-isomerase-like uncharacterized protein